MQPSAAGAGAVAPGTGLTSVPGSRRVAAAALALHAPEQRAEDVVALLVEIALDLGLGDDVRFTTNGPSARAGEAALPVRRPAGGPAVGHLVLRPRGGEAAEVASVLARHAGIALEAAERVAELRRREGRARHVAEELQQALLPQLPEVPGTAIEIGYRPAIEWNRVGGDFYDVFPLPNGCTLIVVGDVMGKDISAATRTSRITQTLRALALQDLPLEDILERCDEQVRYQDPEIMATVWCGLYEPDSGELRFASLGHPPALLLREGGDEVIRLELSGLPLGMRDLTPDAPECRSRLLQPRDLLVLYTDGVVEASGDYLAGQDALLAALLARRDEPLPALLDGALDELLVDAGHRDDAVMLILRRR